MRRLRPAIVVALAGSMLAGCADDGPGAAVTEAMGAVVRIESQRCARPNRAHGLGLVVADDLVVTAGHVVEGDLRSLTVGGEPATVVALDRRSDLAVLHASLPDELTSSSDESPVTALRPDRLFLLGPDGPHAVRVVGRQTLVLEHLTDRRTYRRSIIVFAPGVSAGASGTPLVDAAGRLAGVVILNDDTRDEGIAVSADEVTTLVGASPLTAALRWPDPPGTC